jgi:hypothetical protein
MDFVLLAGVGAVAKHAADLARGIGALLKRYLASGC